MNLPRDLAGAALGALLLFLSSPAWADFDDGERAYLQRDYATAFREWVPLAAKGDPKAQYRLGMMYFDGYTEDGVPGAPKDAAEGMKWVLRAADQGFGAAQGILGFNYHMGWLGLPKDDVEAVRWWRRAAEQGYASSQYFLAEAHTQGWGIPQDGVEAARWHRRAAAQGHARAQFQLALRYWIGRGVPRDLVLVYMWSSLAVANLKGEEQETARTLRDVASDRLKPTEFARAQQMIQDWKPRQERPKQTTSRAPTPTAPSSPPSKQKNLELRGTGSGFVVSRRGHVLTNYHVIEGCHQVRTDLPPGEATREDLLNREAARAIGMLLPGDPGPTSIIATDQQNDLAILQVQFPPRTLASFRDGRSVRQGDAIVALGFPLRGVLASGANLTVGNISAVSGLSNDARYLQITAPVQPGNSGGPLLDQSGNVVGVVVGKLDAIKVARATGDIPQNVNFAIKANVARAFLQANGVVYVLAPSISPLQTADIGDHARRFTVVVECWE